MRARKLRGRLHRRSPRSATGSRRTRRARSLRRRRARRRRRTRAAWRRPTRACPRPTRARRGRRPRQTTPPTRAARRLVRPRRPRNGSPPSLDEQRRRRERGRRSGRAPNEEREDRHRLGEESARPGASRPARWGTTTATQATAPCSAWRSSAWPSPASAGGPDRENCTATADGDVIPTCPRTWTRARLTLGRP